MAALRSFVKIQPITGKSGIAQNMDQVRKSINRMGAVTDGIAKSLYDTTELLKFETEYLSDNSKTEVTTIKRKEKKDKTAWTDSMRKLRRTFRKKKRDRLENEAERGVEEGKEEARKAVAKQKPKLTTFGKFLNGLAKVFKYMIIFGALNWLSNPQNAQKAVKVFKLLFTIGKFAFNIAKMGIGLVFDGLTNVIGNFKDENAIKRAFRGILGVMQLMGGLAVLRTAQYMIMPWKLMKDVNRLRMIFQMTNQQSAEADANRKVRKTGYRDKKTGVIYSKEEYEAMKKSAAKADRKSPGAKRAFEDRFGKESRFTKFKGKASAARKRFGAGANKVFGKLGGKLNVGMSVVGGAGRIAAGLAMGEKTSSAVGAGVGQGIGGLLGGVAGTALLGPFLGPFAPIVGNAIGSFLGEWVGKELGPIMEPIFGPIGKAFKMMFEVVKQTIGPLFKQISEPLGMIFSLIGQLGKVLIDAAGVLGSFVKLIFGGLMDVIGGTVQFVVNNAKRLMNPASIAGGIADALTFNLFDFDKENKKAAGGYVGMAAGGALQFGSHPEVLGAVGGILLKSMVGSFGAFGFVGNKVKAVLSPDIRKISSGLGVKVSTGSGATAGGVSNSVSFKPTQKEEKKVENVQNLTYKENLYKGIHDGLNKLLISGIKIFDPALAAQINQQRQSGIPSGPGGQTPQQIAPSSSGNGQNRYSGDATATGSVPNDPAFIKEVNRVAKKFGIDPTDLLGKIASESGFNPAADNGTHVGLIQFSTDSAALVGKTQSEIKKMSRADQMGLVEKYFDYWKLPYGAGAGHLYTVTFLPAFTNKPGNYVLAKKGGFKDDFGYHPDSWYTSNAGLDMNNDGSITIDELGERIRQKKKEFGIQSLAKGGEIRKKRPKQGAYSEDSMAGGEKLQQFAKGGKIFLHWTGGGYTFKAKGKYHGIIQGDGSVFRAHDYSQRSGVAHTYLRNSSGIGLSIAAMGGKPDYWSVPVKDIQVEAMAKEIANIAKSRGWSPDEINVKNVMTHAEAASGKDGLLPRNDNYGPTMWGGDGTRWDLLRLKKNGKNGEGGNIIRAMARGFMGGDSTVRETDDSVTDSSTTISSTNQDTSAAITAGNQQQEEAKPEKPKTLAEMLAAFETGLKSALTAFGTNVSGGGAETSASGDGVKIDSSVIPEKIQAVGSMKENVAKKLQAIKDKAVRDEEGDIVPVVMEKLVIQKVTQQINTSGSTTAVYTKPSPLLTQ
tara:strand:- start:2703 stop:6374 length:3672 start_codon:yes stop_codon:yes gene_type:complete